MVASVQSQCTLRIKYDGAELHKSVSQQDLQTPELSSDSSHSLTSVQLVNSLHPLV